MTDVRLLYVTCVDTAEAERIGYAVVEQGFAACVNILPGVTSIYRWQGTVERASEAVLIVKVPAAKAEQASALLRQLHSYTIPCILELPVTGGSAPYLAWIAGRGDG